MPIVLLNLLKIEHAASIKLHQETPSSICHLVSDGAWYPFVQLASIQLAPAIGVPSYFLVHLFLIEDKRFIMHFGVDPISVTRAALVNRNGRGTFQGASTITQQLYDARQELLGARRNRTLSRKWRQAIWALAKELHCSKRAILREYLSIVYWGRFYYGLDDAAAGYFYSSPCKLTIAQSFFLSERLASPNVVFPSRVVSLLRRRPIWALFAGNSRLDELIDIYDERFGCGGELCKRLEKSLTL